jgi:UrcA family protein
MRFIAVALIAAAALTGAASATETSKSVEIDFRASDLTNVERLDTLRARIRSAALNVCEVYAARTLAERRIARECMIEAQRQGESQLNYRCRPRQWRHRDGCRSSLGPVRLFDGLKSPAGCPAGLFCLREQGRA